jgi:hypothetical protein
VPLAITISKVLALAMLEIKTKIMAKIFLFKDIKDPFLMAYVILILTDKLKSDTNVQVYIQFYDCFIINTCDGLCQDG